jgi:CubicO group peptidase (beta-lactamase class C family)
MSRIRPRITRPALALAAATCAMTAGLPITAAENGKGDLPAILTKAREHAHLPALGAAVLLKGKVVALDVVGTRKLGGRVAATKDDLFHLGSNTKSMTATLIATLVEDRKLRWNETLPELFPDLAAKMDPGFKAVTLDQLLCHRAGLSGETAPPGTTMLQLAEGTGPLPRQRRAYTEAFLTQKPEYEPGTRFVYSNAGYVIAGAAAERVTGQSWEDLMRKRLFQPLGMKTAGFGPPGTPGREDQPWPHAFLSGKGFPVAPGPRADNPTVIGPAGTVNASLEDWAKYIQANLDDNRILKKEAWKHLHTPPAGADYGFGWGFTDRPWAGGVALTHSGSNTMNYAVVWMAPRKDFAVLTVTNQGGDPAAQACDEVSLACINRYLGEK